MNPSSAPASRTTRAFGAAGVAAACLCAAAPCLAFDYPEHARIAHDALTAVLAGPPAYAGGIEDLLARLEAGLPARGTTCPADERLSVSDGRCLSLADIPALTGDHSASPVLLFWRWFDACTQQNDQLPSLLGDLQVIDHLSNSDKDPETVATGIPNTVSTFVAFVHGPRFAQWPVTVPWTSADDGTLEDFDDSYAALAIEGHSHFRPGLASFDDGYGGQRYRYRLRGDSPKDDHRNKPALNAFAWYADLHTGALLYARAAQLDPAHKATLGAVAMFLELSADHYLEDGVSAGHMVSLARELDPGTLNVAHDHACTCGIDVYPPKRLADAALPGATWPPPLDGVCADRLRGTRIVGDHRLSAGWGKDAGESMRTLAWASAVVQISARELVLAQSDANLDGDARHLLDNLAATTTDSDAVLRSFVPRPRPPSPTSHDVCDDTVRGSETEIYRALVAWWETRDRADARTRSKSSTATTSDTSPAPRPCPSLPRPTVRSTAGCRALPASGGRSRAARQRPECPASRSPPISWPASPWWRQRTDTTAIQGRLGVGATFQENSDGGGDAEILAQLAVRESPTYRPVFFFEQSVFARRIDAGQTGVMAGVVPEPFERTNGVVSLAADAGALYDDTLRRVLGMGTVHASFGFPIVP